MKLSSILFLVLIACILVSNSSFSCISLQKLSVDSVYTARPDSYGITPRIDIEDLNKDSIQVELLDGNYLFTKQSFQKKLQLVSKATEKKVYTIEFFRIVSATKDSIQTSFIYHSYNPKHTGTLSGKELFKKGFMLPINVVDSFTSVARYRRK
jgi:hypothetical protein